MQGRLAPYGARLVRPACFCCLTGLASFCYQNKQSAQRQTRALRRSLGHGRFAPHEGRVGRHARFLCIATRDAQRHARPLQASHREGARAGKARPLRGLPRDARAVQRGILLRQSLQGTFGAGSAEEAFATRALAKVAPVDAALVAAFVCTQPPLSPEQVRCTSRGIR